MREILTKHGIPTTNLMEVSEFISSADYPTIRDFNREFGLHIGGRDDAESAACFAADAILRGATSVDKVVSYVSKRMTGQAAKPEPRAYTVVMAGPAVVDTPEVTIVPVVVSKANTVTVKGRRGRKRLGDSDFCKAVSIIEANPKADRETLKACIIAAGINNSSAGVYLWRYGKGERE